MEPEEQNKENADFSLRMHMAGRQPLHYILPHGSRKEPNEIPQPGRNPETAPRKEPEPTVWPQREPEIQPGREPLTVPPTAPPEIPKGPQSKVLRIRSGK